MPTISENLRILHGRVGPLFLNGIPIANVGPANGWDFIDDDTIGGQFPHNPAEDWWHIEARDLTGMHLRDLTPRLEGNTGANRFVGGGGGWCRWLDGAPYLDSEGRTLLPDYPRAEALDRDDEGNVLLKLDRQVGDSVHILRLDGSLEPRPADHRYIADGVSNPHRHSGGFEVLWLDGIGLVMRRIGDPDFGHVLSTDEFNFWEAIRTTGNQILVATSKSSGEAMPDDVRIYRRLTSDPMGPLVPVPPDPESDDMQALSLKCNVGAFFEFSTRYGHLADPPGNVIVCTEDAAQTRLAASRSRPPFRLVVDADTYDPTDAAVVDRTVALYVSASSLDALGAKATAAQGLRPMTPVYACLDYGDDSDRLPVDLPDDLRHPLVFMALELYRGQSPTEPLAAYTARIDRLMTKANGWGRPLVMIPQAYDRNGTQTEAEVVETLGIQEWAIRSGFVLAVLPFASWRPGGARFYPAIGAWVDAIVRSSPGPLNRYDGLEAESRDDKLAMAENKLGQDERTMLILSAAERAEYLNALRAYYASDPGRPDFGDLRPLVEEVRNRYPLGRDLTPEESGQVINAVAWELAQRIDPRFGLSVKPGGNRVPAPQGDDVSYDAVQLQGTEYLWDCFTAEAIVMRATWSEQEYHGDPDGRPWLAPVQP